MTEPKEKRQGGVGVLEKGEMLGRRNKVREAGRAQMQAKRWAENRGGVLSLKSCTIITIRAWW